MDPIKPCRPYHAVNAGRDLVHGPDPRTVFKVYYVDIVGRAEPARTEWARCGLRKDLVVSALQRAAGVEGVGFVTAFPHIVKVFRFGPEAETVLNVRAWNTRDLADLSLARSDAYLEFACLAEAVIAADEFRFWAEASAVAEYLGRWSDWTEAPIRSHDKLRTWWDTATRPE
jgi:hypothetical protein